MYGLGVLIKSCRSGYLISEKDWVSVIPRAAEHSTCTCSVREVDDPYNFGTGLSITKGLSSRLCCLISPGTSS